MGNVLGEASRSSPETRSVQFRVGVDDAFPKSIAYRLLKSAMWLAEPMRVIRREDKLVRWYFAVGLAIPRGRAGAR